MGLEGSDRLEFGVLGPVEVRRAGEAVRLGGERQRALLALLLVHANQVVSVDRLVDELFGEERSEAAVNAVRVAVSRLRGLLENGDRGSVLLTRTGGYLLRVEPEHVDAARFERLLAEGQGLLASGDPASAAARLREGLGLWRGPALVDVSLVESLQPEIRRWEELRLMAVMDRIEADLALGGGGELIGELERLIAANRLQERLRGQLMLALYRAGRQADALAVYRETSELLRDELGLGPSRRLRELERSILHQDLAVEGPPRAIPAPPVRLPVQPTAFLGRERELAELTALLQSGGARLLTLTGAGGSGKTRLALRAAERCAAEYRDGTWFVGFADISDPQLIASTICQALELAEQPGRTPAERLREWVSEREVLLVLDNLEQLAEGSAVLAEVLSVCPRVTVMATSREPLHLAGEQQYEVPVLEPDDAVALFERRTQAVVPGLIVHPRLADAICARLDYLPLAIELAAARTKAFAPGDILRRLDTRLPLLTGGPRDAPRRQQTLRATLDWSYELLDAEQRRLWARLAVFTGGCTFGAAEAVCGAELDTLQALVDRSLVRHDGERYWMLPTLREYALDRLEQTGGAEELRRSHARWFVGLVRSEGLDAHVPWTPALLGRFRAERENFRGALEWAAESGDSEAVARLAHSLSFHLWVSQGQLQEAQRWVGMALEQLTEYPPRLRVGVLEAATDLASWRGEQKQALAFSEQALAILPQVGDPNVVCDVMMSDGLLAIQGGHVDYARAAIEDVARFAREHDLPHLSRALVNLGDIAIEQGRLDEARALLEEALDCSEDTTSSPNLVALINLSEIAALQGRYRDATSIGRTALATALDHSDQLRAVWAVFHIAWPLAELGELERSGRLIGAATAFLQNAGFARSRSDLLCEKGVLDVLHARLAADTVHRLVQQGRDMPVEDALRDALEETPRSRAAGLTSDPVASTKRGSP
jgi:predicted ATPase/DNA-binding SARP family transcriptional activator